MKVLMMPTVEEAIVDPTNAINQIVLKLREPLRKYDIELVSDANAADLVVGHAGQGAVGIVDVAHCHGLYPTGQGQPEAWHWPANQSVISNLIGAREITVPSEWVADIIRRDMHVNPHVIGWAIDFEDWDPLPKEPYVLWNKTRQDQVCDPTPIERLANRVSEYQFVTTFGLPSQNLQVIGRQAYPKMRDLVRRASVYLATTKETFGIGTLEAMASGCAVLGYRWGGTADLIEHGVTGYLVEPGDIAGLVEGFHYCLKHREVLGQNARKVASSYSWDAVANRISTVYRKAVEPRVGPEISIIIPNHNYGHFVNEAIESVFEQKVSVPTELIVVDDHSTDDSIAVIEQSLFYHRNASGIVGRFMSNDGPRGVAHTRNLGIGRAQGQYIVCLDADDRLGDTGFLQTLYDGIKNRRDLGIVYTGLTMMSETGEIGNRSNWPGEYDFDKQVLGHNQVPTCCMFRREAWERAGGYRQRYTPAEDANLWLRIGSLGYKGRQITTAGMFFYRLHSKSLSSAVRTGQSLEPDWRDTFPWIRDNGRPFASDGQPTPRKFSWPVRNYDRPEVSIVIPVGVGHSQFLVDALDSVEGQTFRYWECIVVNDTGVPLDLVAFPWVREVMTGGENLGAANARNLGILAARAQYVAFLDADDMYHPQFLEHTLRVARSSGKYVYTDWVSQGKDGMYETHETPEYEMSKVFRETSVHSINILIRRDWLITAGLFDTSLKAWEDVELMMSLASNGFCGKRVPIALTLYRYTTGFLREWGETVKADLVQYLRDKYHDFIVEGKTVACCDDALARRQEVPAPASAQDSDAVRVVMDGPFAPVADMPLIGQVTRQNYGSHARGDVFYIWRQDFESMGDHFSEVLLPEEMASTPTPPDPVLL